MDVISDAIETMRTGRPSSSRLRTGRPWRYRFAPYEGAGFHVLLRGSGWLLSDGAAPVPLGMGDVVFVPHGSAHVLADSPSADGAVAFETVRPPETAVPAGTDPSSAPPPRTVPVGPAARREPAASDGQVEFLCGKYRLDRSRAHPLLAGLPEVVHFPAQVGRHAELRAAVDLLGGEVSEDRPGRDTVVAGLLDLLLVYMTRGWLEDNAATGWPRALRDTRIAAALEAMHADPARPWRIDDLAARAGLSRATLARRFTALAGQPPMAYLTWWRMTTAARLLRESDLPLPAVARRVGYGSPYAFSHAFKRQYGIAPGRYRVRKAMTD